MEAVKMMEPEDKIQGINHVTWKQKMKSYKRTPLSFFLWLAVFPDWIYIDKRSSFLKQRPFCTKIYK